MTAAALSAVPLDHAAYPALAQVVAKLVDRWPGHRSQLTKCFGSLDARTLAVCDRMAALAIRLAGPAGGLEVLCDDYRFFCRKLILEEEIHFRRHKRYRLATFAEAERTVYADAGLMRRYLNGQILSWIVWANHARANALYVAEFLPRNRDGYDHLEVGCGHGLLLYFAAADPRCRSVTGWDISDASIDATRHSLETIGIARPVDLVRRDLFAAAGEARFDSIVISEVLEHLERPVEALRALRRVLRPGGRIWINVPVNSPAPDHIYLLRSPEEAVALARDAGLAIDDTRFFPLTGHTEASARSLALSIDVCIIARRPEPGATA